MWESRPFTGEGGLLRGAALVQLPAAEEGGDGREDDERDLHCDFSFVGVFTIDRVFIAEDLNPLRSLGLDLLRYGVLGEGFELLLLALRHDDAAPPETAEEEQVDRDGPTVDLLLALQEEDDVWAGEVVLELAHEFLLSRVVTIGDVFLAKSLDRVCGRWPWYVLVG